MKNGILYRKWETADGSQQSLQWIPPKSCRTELIKTVHSGLISLVVSGRSRGGAQGARAPLWEKWGHTICPEPMSFSEGWGVGGLHGLWKRSKQIYQSYILSE